MAPVSAALVNPRLLAGVRIAWPKAQLPWRQQWQCPAEGIYAFGIEPVTNRFGTRAHLTGAGEIQHLGAGEFRRYDLAVDVLGHDAAIEGYMGALAAHAPMLPEIPARTGATRL